jgi:HEAT repeat protein
MKKMVAPLVAVLNQSGAPTPTVAQALVRLFERYETSFHEGSFIADLVRGLVTSDGVQNLLEALGEATGKQLRELAVVLGWLEGPNVESALAHLIGDPAARNEVIAALVRYGSRVTDLLIEQLRAENPEARQAAVIALGRIGDRRAVPALIEVVNSEED